MSNKLAVAELEARYESMHKGEHAAMTEVARAGMQAWHCAKCMPAFSNLSKFAKAAVRLSNL